MSLEPSKLRGPHPLRRPPPAPPPPPPPPPTRAAAHASSRQWTHKTWTPHQPEVSPLPTADSLGRRAGSAPDLAWRCSRSSILEMLHRGASAGVSPWRPVETLRPWHPPNPACCRCSLHQTEPHRFAFSLVLMAGISVSASILSSRKGQETTTHQPCRA